VPLDGPYAAQRPPRTQEVAETRFCGVDQHLIERKQELTERKGLAPARLCVAAQPMPAPEDRVRPETCFSADTAFSAPSVVKRPSKRTPAPPLTRHSTAASALTSLCKRLFRWNASPSSTDRREGADPRIVAEPSSGVVLGASMAALVLLSQREGPIRLAGHDAG
jgi:hypothetical protein